MGFEADLASGVALHDGFPDLEGLFIFSKFKTRIASLQELASCSILDDGATLRYLRRLREQRQGEKKRQ